MAEQPHNIWDKKPTPPETQIIREGEDPNPKPRSYWDETIDVPWSLVILATIFFIVALFNA